MLLTFTLILVLAYRLVYLLVRNCSLTPLKAWLRALFMRRAGLFNHGYICLNTYYHYRFGTVPSNAILREVNMAEVWNHLREEYDELVVDNFQKTTLNVETEQLEFEICVIVLRNSVMIELGYGTVEVAYPTSKTEFVRQLLAKLASFRSEESDVIHRTEVVGFRRHLLEMN